MGGSPNNVSLWDEADVYALFPEDIEPGKTIDDYFPASPTEPFAEPWKLVGLLNGDAGFEETRDRDSAKHPAWGYGPIIQSFKDAEYERTFTALEDNPVTQRLKSNNDTATDVIVSTHTPAFLAFETRDRRGKARRRITWRPADVVYGGGTENDSDLDEAEFTASIYPDDQKRVMHKQDENKLAPAAASYSVEVTGTPDGGTFTLSVDGVATAPIAYNATSTAVRNALTALASVGAGNATVSLSTGTYTVVLTKGGVLTADGSGLTGGSTPSVSVTAAP